MLPGTIRLNEQVPLLMHCRKLASLFAIFLIGAIAHPNFRESTFWSIVNSTISRIGLFIGFWIARFLFTAFLMAEETFRSFFSND